MSVSEVNKKINEFGITEKTLIYPNELKDMINNSSPKEPVAFIKLTPSAPKVTLPEIKKTTKTDKLGNEEEKVEIVQQQIKIDAIFLPIKPISDDISAGWQSIEGMGLGDKWAYAKWKLYKSFSGIANAVLPSEVVYAMKTGKFGGGIDNPHDRQAFSGHQRRNFTIAWEFMKPNSREEEDTLTKIVSMLRMSALGGYGPYVISPPISWEISFNSFPGYKNFLVYKRCGFTTVSSTFGGEGDFHAMESGLPFLSLSLVGGELDYATQKDMWIRPEDPGVLGEEVNVGDESVWEDQQARDAENAQKNKGKTS